MERKLDPQIPPPQKSSSRNERRKPPPPIRPLGDSVVVCDDLAKRLEDRDREEKAAPRKQWLRVHASPAPDATPNNPHTVYTVDRGSDALSRLKFTELIREIGNTLGVISSPEAAFNAGMDRVWDDAVIEDYEFLQPVDQFYSMPGAVEIRIDEGRIRWSEEEEEQLRRQLAAMTREELDAFRVKRVGELTRVWQAAAISCRRLKQEALATSAKKARQRALRPVTRRGDAKKAGQRLPSLDFPRSPVKRAIRVLLTNRRDFTDRQVCLQLDDDGIEVSSSRLKTTARSFQEMYENVGGDKHKIETMISDVRSRLRKHGLL